MSCTHKASPEDRATQLLLIASILVSLMVKFDGEERGAKHSITCDHNCVCRSHNWRQYRWSCEVLERGLALLSYSSPLDDKPGRARCHGHAGLRFLLGRATLLIALGRVHRRVRLWRLAGPPSGRHETAFAITSGGRSCPLGPIGIASLLSVSGCQARKRHPGIGIANP